MMDDEAAVEYLLTHADHAWADGKNPMPLQLTPESDAAGDCPCWSIVATWLAHE